MRDPGSDPRQPPDPDLELVSVLETNDPFAISLAEALLEESGIPFSVVGEELTVRYGPIGASLTPWRRFVVPADREVQARDILRALPPPSE